MRSSECDVVSLYVVWCSVNVSVCFVCCVFDSVCELFGETIHNVFGETIHNVFGCICHFVVMDVFSVCGGALLDRSIVIILFNKNILSQVVLNVISLFKIIINYLCINSTCYCCSP